MIQIKNIFFRQINVSFFGEPKNGSWNLYFYIYILHLVIWQTLLSKATYNWGVHKAINLEEANIQRKCQ